MHTVIAMHLDTAGGWIERDDLGDIATLSVQRNRAFLEENS
ncbi:MAG: hypothetical protein WBB25_14845 [Sulfitobacter sp.]